MLLGIARGCPPAVTLEKNVPDHTIRLDSRADASPSNPKLPSCAASKRNLEVARFIFSSDTEYFTSATMTAVFVTK